jgi:hypothetical protein
MNDARRETNPNGFAPQDVTEAKRSAVRNAAPRLGCTQTCAYVVPSYYPHDPAHALVTAALIPHVGAALAARRAPAALPSIDPQGKLFYNHVHKAYGFSFLEFVRRLPGVRWCSHLVAPDNVSPSDWGAFAAWWFDPAPNCTLVSLEEPKLAVRTRHASAHQTAWPITTLVRSTLVRRPIRRC